MIILSVFVFIPLVSSMLISFMDMDIFMNDAGLIGFNNYMQMGKDPRFWNAMGNTLFFTMMHIPLQIIIAVVLASVVATNKGWARLMRTIYYIPTVCSMTAIGITFAMLLDPNMGLLPFWLRRFGIGAVSFLKSTTLAMPTLAAISVWKGFGYTLTILTAAILVIPQSLYEAADIDGAGFWRRFFDITVPGIWTAVSFCVVTTTITSLQMFDQAYIMTKGGPLYHTETIVQYIYNRGFQTAPYSLGYASTMSVAVLILVAVITFILRRFFMDKGDE
ncbi:MAG: sugar ABC transporter permease [Treponema sp.]|nr:sugar ABC transporter permease [Treponema sp.]